MLLHAYNGNDFYVLFCKIKLTCTPYDIKQFKTFVRPVSEYCNDILFVRGYRALNAFPPRRVLIKELCGPKPRGPLQSVEPSRRHSPAARD